jgi:hypothetical protein
MTSLAFVAAERRGRELMITDIRAGGVWSVVLKIRVGEIIQGAKKDDGWTACVAIEFGGIQGSEYERKLNEVM